MSESIEYRLAAEISREMLKSYAEASGDHNPIHLDDEVAKKSGLPGVIAHGMLVASFVSNRAVAFQKEKLGSAAQLKKIQFRFKAMTFPEEKISVGGRLREKSDHSVIIELDARNEQEEVKTAAKVEFRTGQTGSSLEAERA